MNDSAVLTSAGSSYHHCGVKTEKSCDFDDRHILARSNGGTRRSAEVVQWSTRTGVCGLVCEGILSLAQGGAQSCIG